MAWDDKPSEAQLNKVYYWIRWEMPTAEAVDAVKWLGENANRKTISDEMNRLHDMKQHKTLNRESIFKGDIWRGYFNNKGAKE